MGGSVNENAGCEIMCQLLSRQLLKVVTTLYSLRRYQLTNIDTVCKNIPFCPQTTSYIIPQPGPTNIPIPSERINYVPYNAERPLVPFIDLLLEIFTDTIDELGFVPGDLDTSVEAVVQAPDAQL